MRYQRILLLVITFLFFPGVMLAHQPRLVENRLINIEQPDISKAYYAELQSEPDVYQINVSVSFDLYLNLLVPDTTNQKTDIVAVLLQENQGEKSILTVLGGPDTQWQRYWEKYGRDWYLKGPEYRARLEPGNYQVVVSSENNNSKYTLAVGERELFNFKESVNALRLILKIKRNFFNSSPVSFLLSPLGYGYVLIMLVLAFIFGFIYRLIMKKVASGKAQGSAKNINLKDRLLRAFLGIVLLAIALVTTWNPLLLFFSGFCFFEAIFSWCGFYALIGKNSCPL